MAKEERFYFSETRTFNTNGETVEQGFAAVAFLNRGSASANIIFNASDANEPAARRTITIQAGQILNLESGNRGWRGFTVNASGTTLDIYLGN